MLSPTLWRSAGVAALALTTALAHAAEGDYPNRPVRMIVPFAPGGASDFVGRIIQPALAEQLRQQVVVDNRSGAAGNIGVEVAARATPDGYNFLLGNVGTMAINPNVYTKFPVRPLRDLAGVTQVVDVPGCFVIHPSLPVKNLKEMIAYLKANPGKLNYGSQGIGSGAHLATLQFQKATGTEMVHIPFTGAAPALQGLASGQIDLFIDNLGTSLSLHQAGQLKILAVGSAERAPELPDVPSLREAGLKDIELTTWFGLFAPPKTPAPIAAKLSQAVGEALKEPEVASRFKTLGLTPAGSTPQDFAKFLAADRARWKTFIEAAKISN
jgi:tripartite-type tricarboxylate transporter receptor subunit TctC